MNDADCVRFLQATLPHLGLRWPGFRKVRKQVCKRVGRRARLLGLADSAAYVDYLHTHPAEWQTLDAMCRISISRFYREKGVYDALRDRILPNLAETGVARGDPAIHAWSAGCASGEEPYTLTLLWSLALARQFPDVRLHITATDADRQLLDRAARGVYPRGCLKELPQDWIDKGFENCDGEFRLRSPFRRNVVFLRQDIREHMPDGPFDLILCRNLVFTYFDGPLQRTMLERLTPRLRNGGFLVVGTHEALPTPAPALVIVDPRLPIYRRQANTAMQLETAAAGAGPVND